MQITPETTLANLGISSLNPMQQSAQKAIASKSEVLLISPTGSGKTLAYLLQLTLLRRRTFEGCN
jgi:Lhr-like helicase